MGNKKAGKNYRKLYKEHYGIEFGEDMAVHHIVLTGRIIT